jgi:NAD(P) transhydrogenase subunit alpha
VRIAVAREQAPGEARVAMVPELVGRLRAAGYQVAVQAGAGVAALLADAAYEAAGALVTEHPFDEADVVLSVQPLDASCLAPLPSGATTISFFPHSERPTDVALRRDRKLTTFGMEYVPRISRAQSMDALSSQALVAGYRGAIVATCRRLGAVVKGYDVRAAAAEEIRSMGAQAIELPLPTLEGAGGYAREMTEERAQRQRELLASYIASADALITTAAVPGRRAPLLVTTEMIAPMAPGSVVVDLAAEAGGNVEGVVAGKVVRVGSVQLWGGADVPSQMPGPASRLYAQNVLNVIMLMTRDGRFAPDFDDEITAAMCVTHDGQVLADGG